LVSTVIAAIHTPLLWEAQQKNKTKICEIPLFSLQMRLALPVAQSATLATDYILQQYYRHIVACTASPILPESTILYHK
jgi:hypothetical protein